MDTFIARKFVENYHNADLHPAPSLPVLLKQHPSEEILFETMICPSSDKSVAKFSPLVLLLGFVFLSLIGVEASDFFLL